VHTLNRFQKVWLYPCNLFVSYRI